MSNKQLPTITNAVRVTAYDASGKIVFQQVIDLHEYYDGEHPVIDNNQFRRRRKIVRLVGTVYDANGKIEEEWENSYSQDGKVIVPPR